MRFKKAVMMILLFVLICSIPLRALSQIQPRLTYEEWCNHIDSLYQDRETLTKKSVLPLVLWITTIPLMVMWVATDAMLWLTLGLLADVAGCTWYVLTLSRQFPLQAEIAKWERAGEPHMWFYPCR